MKLLLLLLLCTCLLHVSSAAVVYEANIVSMKTDNPVLGGTLRRRCVASPPTLTWSYRWTHPSGETSQGSQLQINSLRVEDFGTYTCVAEAPGNYRLVTYDVVRRDGTSVTRGRGRIGEPPANVRGSTGQVDRLSGPERGGGGGSVGGRSEINQNSRWRSQSVSNNQNSGTRLGLNNPQRMPNNQYSAWRLGVNNPQQGGAEQYINLRIRSAPGENLVIGGRVRRRCFVDRPGFNVVWIYPDGRQVPGEVLAIDNVGLNNEGVYRCQASGMGRVLSGTFTVSFEATERRTSSGVNSRGRGEFARIRMEPLPGESLVYGGAIRRLCRVSEPGWTITWRFPDSRTIDNSYLSLDNLSLRHAGTYWCIARKGGAQLRMSFRIAFQQEGRGMTRLDIRAESGENLVIGGTVRRRCSIGQAGWTKEWIFPNGQRLNSDLLSLDNIGLRDQGVYVCRARGSGGQYVNATFELRFQRTSGGANEPVRIRLETLPGENFVHGGTVRRQCRVSEPGWNIGWEYPDKRTTDSSYLWLTNLSQRHAGTYWCIARKNGAQLRMSFRIAFQQDQSGQTPNIQIAALGSETVQFGGSLRRECRISESGWSTIWRLPKGRTLRGPILFIERLGPEHAGTYTCIATKGGSRIQRSFEVQLQSTRPGSETSQVARITLRTLADENFVYGGTVRRRCEVSAPGWTIIWQYPNGRTVESSYLWLDNIKETNSGTYWCIATKDGARLRLSFRMAFTSEQQSRKYSGLKTVQITIAPRIAENLIMGGEIHRRCQATNTSYQVTWLDPEGRLISGSNNLDLNQMRANQLGRYKCVARGKDGAEVTSQMMIRNPAGDQLDIRTLTIQKLPYEQLRIGGVIQRRCLAPSGWNVHWQLPSGGIQPGDTIRIDNLSPSNAGAYYCVAEGPSQQLLKSSFRIILIADNTPAYTTLRIRALPGESLVLGGSVRKDCIVNSANWDVHWRKPNRERVNSRYLTLTNLQPRDSGRYECVGEDRNSDRRLVAWFDFRLQETRLQSAEINVETLSGENLITGGSIRRRCVVTQPGYNIFWTRPDGSRIDSETLIINQLTPAMSGRYICHARHPTSGAMMSSWFSVAIRAAQSSTTNVDVNVMPGENLVIGGAIRRDCVVTSPDWIVYWQKPDGTRVDSRYLTITNLQASHAGRYTCFAQNRRTQKILNTWFTVTFSSTSQATLRITAQPGESLVAGGKVRRLCRVSESGWRVFWMLPNGTRTDGETLAIDNLEVADSGRYTCRAEKAGGGHMQTWFSFQIVRVATIHMDTMPDESLQIGGTLSQRCRMSNSGWSLRWELPDGSVVQSDSLRITNLSRRHYGKYWCIATNRRTGDTRRAWYQLGR